MCQTNRRTLLPGSVAASVPRRPALAFLAQVLAAFMGVLAQLHASVVVGPFLEGATTTNVYVLAECSSNAPMTVNYGTTTSYGMSAATAFTRTSSGTTNVQRVKLTGLQPNTLYHYQLVGQGVAPTDYTFRTLVNPGTDFRFVWQADFRSNPTLHDQIAGRILNTSNPAPLFVLEGGDTCANGDWAGWHSEYFTTNEKELAKRYPVYPSPGNHEGWGTLTQAYYQSPDSTGANGYYSFDCGDLHVTMGNYQTTYSSGSAQYNWIQQDLQASRKAWKIFGFHAPAYTWGGSGAHAGDAGAQTISLNLLEPNGVKVFLAGHNHFYQHNLVRGVHHIICGAAGAPLVAVSSDPTYTITSISDNCYLVIDATPTNLRMVAYNNTGGVLETIDLVKLAAPTGVTATPGSGQATLTWNAVPGATSNTVWYGTTQAGPYASKKAVAAASATVTGLTNGTRYYFVVTANDANGPSATSAQVSATPTNPPPAITAFGIEGGNFTLTGQGAPGQICVLLTSADVAAPITWTPVVTNTADGSGRFSLADPQAASSAWQRFYCVRSP